MCTQDLTRAKRRIIVTGAALTSIILGVSASSAQPGQVFLSDIATGGGAGLAYSRLPSPTRDLFQAIKERSLDPATPYDFGQIVLTPEKDGGAPGVAIFDHDRDGDQDLYVTNGPGRPNSLFSSQLRETGALSFVDVALQAGVGATAQDSTGVCFGDLDNDGDHDLLVLGRLEPNRLFENRGDGTFADVTGSSGVGGGNLGHTSCSMGDIDNDGLLDIVVGNTFDWASREAIFTEPFSRNHPDQLYLNLGGNRFRDVSESSGIRRLNGFAPGTPADVAAVTWAIAMVDYDQDGDADVIAATDQGGVLPARYGGVDRGFLQILQNDGTGRFVARTDRSGTAKPGQWMGLSFGDFNCDGFLDVFGTNMGDYILPTISFPYSLGESAARWFYGRPDGGFDDPGLGSLVADPFGWGTSALDYDNDGFTDIFYYGHLTAAAFLIASENPGAVLRNLGCSGSFDRDALALSSSVDHNRRAVQGVAAGDLNDDGFVDVVTVAEAVYPAETVPLTPYSIQYGGPFDADSFYVEQFAPIPGQPGAFRWTGVTLAEGDLAVEINSADNGNNWAAFDLVGTVGRVSGGRVNRDGIGAIVRFTPAGGKTVMRPVLGGSSYASQDSLRVNVGLGDGRKGTVEVLWPGGVRNRLYDVHAAERLTLPEIPCSFDAAWPSEKAYKTCVQDALGQLARHGLAGDSLRGRLLASALRAFREERR